MRSKAPLFCFCVSAASLAGALVAHAEEPAVSEDLNAVQVPMTLACGLSSDFLFMSFDKLTTLQQLYMQKGDNLSAVEAGIAAYLKVNLKISPTSPGGIVFMILSPGEHTAYVLRMDSFHPERVNWELSNFDAIYKIMKGLSVGLAQYQKYKESALSKTLSVEARTIALHAALGEVFVPFDQKRALVETVIAEIQTLPELSALPDEQLQLLSKAQATYIFSISRRE